MRSLFEQYEELSRVAEARAEELARTLRERRAPSRTLQAESIEALAKLREKYEEIQRELARRLPEGEVPSEEVSVTELRSIWEGSTARRREALRAALEAFLRVCSEEQRYMDAIQPLQERARLLMEDLDAALDDAQARAFSCFVEGVETDLAADEELALRIEDGVDILPHRAVTGLMRGKYHLRPRDAESAPAAAPEACSEAVPADAPEASPEAAPEAEQPNSIKEEAAPVAAEAEPEPAAPIAEEVQPEPEPAAPVAEEVQPEPEPAAPVAVESKPAPEPTAPVSAEAEPAVEIEYIHPVKPIRKAKLPSEQKLMELIQSNGSVLACLMEKLGFQGLLDLDVLYRVLTVDSSLLSREFCEGALAALERKGYICTYDYEGRSILCFTQLMADCVRKPSLNGVLKRLFSKIKIRVPVLVAKQDMPLDEFLTRLEKVDRVERIVAGLADNQALRKLLATTGWDAKRQEFMLPLSLPGEEKRTLVSVPAENFASFAPGQGEGAICRVEQLPDLAGVEDAAHFCLCAGELHRWMDGRWQQITSGASPEAAQKPTAEDTAARADVDAPELEACETAPEADVFGDAAPEAAEPSDESAGDVAPVEEAASANSDAVEEIPAAASTEEAPEQADSSLQAQGDEASERSEGAPTMAEDAAKFEDLPAREMAELLLERAAAGEELGDETMEALIRRLIEEGECSYENERMHDQVVEACVLAKLLSTDGRYPRCRAIYLQLHAAIPLFQDDPANSGLNLMNAFAEEMELSAVARLCAYIHGMLFPANIHDDQFKALYRPAFKNYEENFPGLDALKPLYHKAMQSLAHAPAGFSPANLAAITDSRSQRERLKHICSEAGRLLKAPQIRIMMNGVPELLELCFGHETPLYAALKVVSENDVDSRELVVEAYYQHADESGNIDMEGLNRELDALWLEAARRYSSRRMGIKYEARKHFLNGFCERLRTLRSWLDETGDDIASDIEWLQAMRLEILKAMDQAERELRALSDAPAANLALASLDLMRVRLCAPGARQRDFSTMLRSGALVFDGSTLVLNDTLNEIQFAEPWRMMLRHIACAECDLRKVYRSIIDATDDSELYDNLGQLEEIGRRIGADPEQYEPSESVLAEAARSADIAAKRFRELLEISYAYNRIDERDRERLVLLSDLEDSDFRDYFYENRAFGCWRAYLNALRLQIDEASLSQKQKVLDQLRGAQSRAAAGESRCLLEEAERLIEQEQNFAVAEDYIHRYQNGERDLPFELEDSVTNYFLEFISDGVFDKLYRLCDDNKQKALSKFGMRFLADNRPEKWRGHVYEDAQKFISSWPESKQGVSAESVRELFVRMGFDVTSAKRRMCGGEVCCTLNVRPTKQNLADYRHPIARFGTLMKNQLDVVCLFGKRTAKQLVDDACQLNLNDTFVVLLDAVLPIKDRQTIAEYVFTRKNVGQAPFLVIDRVLALYLTLQPERERLPAMLQCTLPYTICQPFDDGSGATADEMFSGRVYELAAIRNMGGATIVYGGRQLGKTALLERAKHLDSDPENGKFVVMTSFKGCRGEKAFVDILVQVCNETFNKYKFRVEPCDSIRAFTSQLRCLIDEKKISELRLFMDEADDFLDSISGNRYDEIEPLILLMREFNGKFKFVFAGLHNVCRTKNAYKENGVLGKLGQPLCIKPLTAADAKNLLVRPLSYLGFRISGESHIDTILTNTNYYPGIIQFFGYTLVQTLASKYSQYYSAVRGNPPFDLQAQQLASIMNSQDLNNNIKDRIRLTLSMDERYYMLARCITVLYHLSGKDYSVLRQGFDIDSIRMCIEVLDIHCLASLDEREIVSLLDEMEEMGILSRPDIEEKRYLLRRRSFIDVIGPNLSALEREIARKNEEASDDE